MGRDDRDYRLDLSGLPQPQDSSSAGGQSSMDRQSGLPFLSVQFACCNVYTRIYRNAQGTAYVGRCPRCGKSVSFRIGPHGTDARFFVVH
jgi:hypothetical protein